MKPRQKAILHFLSIAIIFIAVANNLNWHSGKTKGLIQADARGYYAYLPAIFIHNDVDFAYIRNIDPDYKQYHPEITFWKEIDGKIVNKYPIGTAILLSPFFAIAHTITVLSGGLVDGYSFWYQLMVNVAAIFYALLGLILMYRLLRRMKLAFNVSMLIVWTLAFASPVFYYAIKEPGMSHIYSFALVAGFCNVIWELRENRSKWVFFLAAVLLGLITVIRPVNVLILFAVPFLVGDFASLKEIVISAFRSPLILLLVFGGFFACICPQFIYFFDRVGKLWVDTYPGEHFNFAEPHIIDFLFSYKKGFFLYTPVAFFSLLGLWFIGKKNQFQAVSFILFLGLVIYVFSSWWSWWYGGSFSSRVMIEYLPFFGILLGYLFLENRKVLWRKVFSGFLIAFIIIGQIQTYQYRYSMIHYENTTKEMYWENFLRIDKLINHKKTKTSPAQD